MPKDIFDYIYGVLHSPAYRAKFKEFLKVDFPRIPYPKDAAEFARFRDAGRELRATHLMGLPFSYAWKAKRYEQVSTKVKTGNDLHMSNGAFELMTHVWHPEQFAEKIRGPFEDLQCLIPKKYDEVLTVLFGKDYMTPPPVEERVAKHLDL